MVTRKLLTGGPLGRVLFSVPVLGATVALLYPAFKVGPLALIIVGLMANRELTSLIHRANPSAETTVQGATEYFYDYMKFSKASALASGCVVVGLLVAIRMYVDDPWLLMVIAVAVYANDSFAWLVGSTLGRRFTAKLFWQYSPSKTWEGTVGGVAVTILAAWLLSGWVAPVLRDGSLFVVLLTAAASSVGAILADMLGSALKRFIGVKDSSPNSELWCGHGGWVDRFLALFGGLATNAALQGLLLTH